MDIKEEKKRIYEKMREEIVNAQVKNSESFDKAILTISTALLGFSIGYIQNIVNIKQAQCNCLLIYSWSGLTFSIIITIVSFMTSQKSMREQLSFAEQYYLKDDNDYLTKKNNWITATTVLNTASGIVLVVSIVITVIFVSINLK